jgi:cysteinyl-tRNA synthetase
VVAGEAPQAFLSALEDVFNTPAAMAVLFDLVSKGNALVEKVEVDATPENVTELRKAVAEFSSLAAILGIDPVTQWPRATAGDDIVAPLVDYLLELRERARRDRDFATADAIRERLGAAGIAVEDRPAGPRWRIAR